MQTPGSVQPSAPPCVQFRGACSPRSRHLLHRTVSRHSPHPRCMCERGTRARYHASMFPTVHGCRAAAFAHTTCANRTLYHARLATSPRHTERGNGTPDIDTSVSWHMHDRQSVEMQWLHTSLATPMCTCATATCPLSVSPRALHSYQDNSEQNIIAQRRMAGV